MTRSLKVDIPGPDRRTTLECLQDDGIAAVFAEDVEKPEPLVVELGFGRGEFLMDLAAQEPDVAFLGVDYSHKRVWKLARRLAVTPLKNVRALEARAEDVVAALPVATVRTFVVNFPDPWPKFRHQRRRMLQAPFVAELAARLVPDGILEVATDHEGYAQQIDKVLAAEPGLENVLDVPYRDDVPGRRVTAYEAAWRAEGRNLHFWTYRRLAE
ncbi:MAG: tRNA (guanine(46)-N(7))-methyltransferase TrmB [Myxococcota bacterium]